MMQAVTGQMKYIFPVIVVVISYTLTAAVALYWATSNLFHVFQELYVKKHHKIDDQSAIAFDI